MPRLLMGVDFAALNLDKVAGVIAAIALFLSRSETAARIFWCASHERRRTLSSRRSERSRISLRELSRLFSR